jgi:hypothetical protein
MLNSMLSAATAGLQHRLLSEGEKDEQVFLKWEQEAGISSSLTFDFDA